MSSQNNNDNSKKQKLDKKDLIIIGISVVSLVLLILIILISKNHDRALSEALNRNSDITAGDLLTMHKGSYDYLEITEVCGDKWIELHNKGNETIDLSGIEVFVSGKKVDTIEDGKNLNKNDYYVIEIDINPGNGTSNVLTMLDKDGNQITTILVPKLSENQSYGRTDEETNKWGYITPSKKKINNTKKMEYIKYDGISFSAPGGFYDETFTLELKADDGETIYYTTDGTRPTTDSVVYEEAITISNKSGRKYVYASQLGSSKLNKGYEPGTVDAGMIVRAIAVNSSGKVTKEASQAYYLGLRKDTDYLNIPVLSVTTDPENLFDYEEGIYVPGKAREDALIQDMKTSGYGNYLNGWKKSAKIEYFEPDKGKSLELNLDMSIYADSSCYEVQKGFEFDLGDTDYSAFDGSGIIDYISSQGKIRLLQNYDDNILKVRNQIVDSLAEDTETTTLDRQPCILFIEGEYWGVYSLNSYFDEKYIARHYDISDKEIIFNEPGQYVEALSELYSFAADNDMSVPENYERAKAMLDIDNYIDYICLNIALGNSELDSHSCYAWRTLNTEGKGYSDGRWRFICGDMSDTMYYSAKQTSTINTYLQLGIQSDLLLQSLLMNDEFCKTFKSRMDTMIPNIFAEEKYTNSIDKAVQLMKKPALASYSRFYGNASDKAYMASIDNISAYFEERPEYLSKYTEEFVTNGGNVERAKVILEELEQMKKDKESALDNGEEPESDEMTENEEGIESESLENILSGDDNNVGYDMTVEEANGENMQDELEKTDDSMSIEQTQEEERNNGAN